jgi:hypothetical protein
MNFFRFNRLPVPRGNASPTPVALGGTGSNTAQGAAASLAVAYILAKSFVAVSCPADATEDTLATIAVPANALGANGALRITTLWSFSGAGGTRTPRVRFNGAAGTQYLVATTGSGRTSLVAVTAIGNRNATNSQVGNSIDMQDSGSGLGAATVTSAADTTGATSVVITGQKASAGDVLTLEGYIVELLSNGA